MKISLWRMAAVGVVFLAGCSGSHSVSPSMGGNLPGTSSGMNKPDVVQTGKVPIHWTQFNDPATGFGPTFAIAAGPDKNMYFGNNQGGLMRVGMGGGATLVPLQYKCNATTFCNFVAGYGMVLGHDNKFYMGGTNFDSTTSHYAIGVATTVSGHLPVREIPSGDYVSNGGFSVGPDNNVWFTEQKHVARITPAGVITEFTYPSAATTNSDGATAAGPDGNVWFTEYNSGKVGKINPTSHAITEYDVAASPNFCNNPAEIVAGPDGNMYFECAYGYLGQITTAGVAQRFYDAYGTSFVAEGLIKGPDGNPWFADQNGDFIGEFNPPDQSFKTYVPPYTGGTIYSIAIGPDGNIWAHENIAHTDVFIIHTLVVTPNKLTFTATGQTAFLTVTEPGTTAWTATSVSPGVCSVAQSSPANKFKVTAAGLGTTSITIKDTIGNYFVIPCHV